MPARHPAPLDEYILPRVRYRTRAGVLAIAVIILVAGVLGVALGFTSQADPGLPLGQPWMPYVIAVGAAVPLLVKRRWPVVAVAGAGAVVLLDVATVTGTLGLITVLAFFDCIYAAMLDARSRLRRLALGVAIATALLLVGAWLLRGDLDPVEGLRLLLSLGLLVAAPTVWGISVRQRDELLAAETARADAVARAAAAERERAVLDERAAMAHDLHDELAARLSAIALQSAALAARSPADDAAAASVRAIRSSSVEALDELRQLIDVLTSGRDEAPVPEGIEDVGALRRDAERFGVELDARVDVPDGVLGTAASHALMRIAREALVNAARHAPGQRVRLRVAAEGATVTLAVENALPAVGERGAEGNGLGTVLMAQRWRAVGGSGSVGATDDARWVVRAEVPRHEGAVA